MPSLVLYALENSRGYTEKIRMFLAETGMVRASLKQS
jgi:hypothetical protein